MLEGGGRSCFVDKANPCIRIERELGGKELEGHVTAELEVLGLVNNAHAPSAEALENLVVRDGLTDEGIQRHASSTRMTGRLRRFRGRRGGRNHEQSGTGSRATVRSYEVTRWAPGPPWEPADALCQGEEARMLHAMRIRR